MPVCPESDALARSEVLRTLATFDGVVHLPEEIVFDDWGIWLKIRPADAKVHSPEDVAVALTVRP